MLNRLQHGVARLLENSVDPKGLTEVLVGKDSILKNIVKEFSEEIEQSKIGNSQIWDNYKDVELTEDLEAHMLHNLKVVPLVIKDWQAGKAGSKNSACNVSTSVRRILLKHKEPRKINMHKFMVGFGVQDNSEKNIILPDQVELFGSVKPIGDNVSAFPDVSIMHKICDLEVIEDQNFYQFGVKIFGINFNTLTRKFRNQVFSALEIRLKSDVVASCSDVLESNLKANKGTSYQLSFLSIIAHQE